MGKLSGLPGAEVALLAVLVLMVVVWQVAKRLQARRRDALHDRQYKSVTGQVLLYLFFVALFGLDFFLILRRDSFRVSWSLTFWMVLAAFMLGEAFGRWNSARGANETADPPKR
jgi:cytochrome bd-type quinol oxidase subunit 2